MWMDECSKVSLPSGLLDRVKAGGGVWLETPSVQEHGYLSGGLPGIWGEFCHNDGPLLLVSCLKLHFSRVFGWQLGKLLPDRLQDLLGRL